MFLGGSVDFCLIIYIFILLVFKHFNVVAMLLLLVLCSHICECCVLAKFSVSCMEKVVTINERSTGCLSAGHRRFLFSIFSSRNFLDFFLSH